MKITPFCALVLAATLSATAAVEEPIDHRFKPASTDPQLGDWQGTGGVVAQVTLDEHGDYQANLLKAFDAENSLITTLHGQSANGRVSLRGGGWSATIEQEHFKGAKDGSSFDLQRTVRPSPTMGAKAPGGAVVLFDGKNMNVFANKKGKEWLVEDGPAPWKIVEGGILEVVPGTGGGIITKQKFGDCHLHVEFRILGAPSNSGVFLQTRYEADIGENYGRTEGGANGNLGNCTPKGTAPRVRATRPMLEWQTFDIDFRAPRFDAAGGKTAAAHMTVVLNGVKIYDQQELNLPTGAAGRLGEAPTGPLMLQEHGMPLQFRNIWLVEPPR